MSGAATTGHGPSDDPNTGIAKSALAALRARVAKLEAALEPFAHFGKFCDETHEDYEDNRTFSSVHITCGMMRLARAALKGDGEGV